MESEMEQTVCLSTNASFTGADELDEVLNLRQRRKFTFNFGQSSSRSGKGLAEKDFIRLFQDVLGVSRKPITCDADLMVGMHDGWWSVTQHVRRNILTNLGTTADHDQFSDPAKLMHGDVSPQNDIVLQNDVTSQAGKSGHDDMITKDTIVRYMNVGQKKIV